jgi:hypothetical protein
VSIFVVLSGAKKFLFVTLTGLSARLDTAVGAASLDVWSALSLLCRFCLRTLVKPSSGC